jgi:hypothetical protein
VNVAEAAAVLRQRAETIRSRAMRLPADDARRVHARMYALEVETHVTAAVTALERAETALRAEPYLSDGREPVVRA